MTTVFILVMWAASAASPQSSTTEGIAFPTLQSCITGGAYIDSRYMKQLSWVCTPVQVDTSK